MKNLALLLLTSCATNSYWPAPDSCSSVQTTMLKAKRFHAIVDVRHEPTFDYWMFAHPVGPDSYVTQVVYTSGPSPSHGVKPSGWKPAPVEKCLKDGNIYSVFKKETILKANI